jgi:hypothetical protein
VTDDDGIAIGTAEAAQQHVERPRRSDRVGADADRHDHADQDRDGEDRRGDEETRPATADEIGETVLEAGITLRRVWGSGAARRFGDGEHGPSLGQDELVVRGDAQQIERSGM